MTMAERAKRRRAQRDERVFVDEGPNESLKGQRFGLEVKGAPLFEAQSAFQKIQVLETVAHGRALVLDGVVQLTEQDEFAYHEMIVHVPLSCLARDRIQILLIGAGDGGALREIMRYDRARVDSVFHVEIDGAVVDACKEFLPSVSAGAFLDSRLALTIGDGFDFVAKTKDSFDAVIVDSSDPSQGPNGPLFEASFYANLGRLMRSESVLCVQAENPWFYLDLVTAIARKLSSVFSGRVRYYGTQVPTYPGGFIGFFLCWNSPKLDECWSNPKRLPQSSLRYYSADVHTAAFVLPKFIAEAIQGAIAEGRDSDEK